MTSPLVLSSHADSIARWPVSEHSETGQNVDRSGQQEQ